MSGIAHPHTPSRAGTSSASREGHDARQKLLAPLPVTERHVDCGGLSTAVLEGGDGPPLILLHGPFGHAPHWMRIIPSLSRDHHIIAPDLPGHGSSESPALPLDAESVLRWLSDLIEHCAGSPPLLVGQTLGGAMAARFAIENSHRIRGLVLVDTFGLSAFDPQPEFARVLGEFFANPTDETHRALWEQCAFDLAAVRRGMGRYWDAFEAYGLERARTPALSAVLRALMQVFATTLPDRELAAISTPTTLIWGRHDRVTSLSVAQAASERFGWPLTIIESASDEPQLEQPEAFMHALRAVAGER